jgi:glutamate-1-semialdehyde 2,1-aminomutase
VALCRQHEAVFILDEMITGFRWHVQAYYGIEPDLCTFGKPWLMVLVAALGRGKRNYADWWNTRRREGAERIFLTSTTHGAEMSALGAFIKTMSKEIR